MLARLFTKQICIECGQPGGLFCAKCQEQYEAPPPYQEQNVYYRERRATAIYAFGVELAVQALKTDRRYADTLGDRLFVEYVATNWAATMIVPVPLSAQRLAKRGFNQAAALARRVAWLARLPYAEPLRKVRETRQQKTLREYARLLNQENAYQAAWVTDQRVVIIDDVSTTGTTFNDCARALREAGANEVWCLSVAATLPKEELPHARISR
jgi:ComF family protein